MKFFKKYSPSVLLIAFVAVLATLFFVSPKTTYSETEKRFLSPLPAVTPERLLDGSIAEEFEAYLADHFPLRNAFVGLQSYYELVTGRGGVADVYFGEDGFLIAAQAASASEDTVRTNMENYAAFADYLGLDASMIVVPQTGYSLSDKLPAVHRPYSDDAFFAAAEDASGSIALIDLRGKLGADDYFKTDHHLTMNGATALYTAYTAARDLPAHDDYTVERYDGFYGTQYSASGYWASEPDAVELFKSPLADEVTVRISESGRDEETVYDSLFFPAHLENMDKYPVYLNGNNGLVTIENPEAPEGSLLILKDSFAHNVTTLLCQNYREIIMIDLRYYSDSADNTVRDIVEERGIKDVLFLYGMDSLATDSSASFKLFYGMEDALT